MPNPFNSYDDLIDPNYQKMSLIQALLAAAAKVNPGPTTMPQSLGSALPAAMGQGLQSYMGSQQAGLQQAGLAEKLREMKEERQFRDDLKNLPTTKTNPEYGGAPNVGGINAESYQGADYTPPPEGFSPKTTPLTMEERLGGAADLAMNKGRLEDMMKFATARKGLGQQYYTLKEGEQRFKEGTNEVVAGSTKKETLKFEDLIILEQLLDPTISPERKIQLEKLWKKKTDIAEKEGPQPSAEQRLIDTMQNDPDPAKRTRAEAIYKQEQKGKIDVATASGEARASSFAKTRGPTVWDTVKQESIPMTWDKYSEAYENEPSRYLSMSDPRVSQMQAEAKQRGGATTANVTAAVKMYRQEAPELIGLRAKVQKKGLLPTGELKSIEGVNQWLGVQSSDPDTALLKKKTKFLADSLMRVIGGTQGGEWAFKVAADILDPTLSTDAFKSIVVSHGIAMDRMAKARQGFGESEGTPTAEIVQRKPGETIADYLKRTGK